MMHSVALPQNGVNSWYSTGTSCWVVPRGVAPPPGLFSVPGHPPISRCGELSAIIEIVSLSGRIVKDMA
jgi:hypothetical protein